MKDAVAGFVVNLPCRLLGHRWVEVPRALRGRQESMRFQCSRCHLAGGFTN